MASLFDPDGDSERLHAPATARNREVILEVLKSALPAPGTLFEVASGTGEHGVFMAPELPDHIWQPSDIDPGHIASINAWRSEMMVENMRLARRFDVLADSFTEPPHDKPLTGILAVNLIHIAPWVVAETLIEKSGKALPAGGLLYLYGPYKRGGEHISQSNADFDVSLKSRNESWGVRDMEAVIKLAEKAGFKAPEITPMPANNFSLVFRK